MNLIRLLLDAMMDFYLDFCFCEFKTRDGSVFISESIPNTSHVVQNMGKLKVLEK